MTAPGIFLPHGMTAPGIFLPHGMTAPAFSGPRLRAGLIAVRSGVTPV